MTADTPALPNPLQPVDEDWQRGLAIVAQPDDLEFGAAAAIGRWTRQGKEMVYVLLTSGGGHRRDGAGRGRSDA